MLFQLTELKKHITPRQLCLWGVLTLVTLLVLRRYSTAIELPTEARIQEKIRLINSRANDLAVQQKMNADWQASLLDLQTKTEGFWMRRKPDIPLEQEISDEFRDIQRMASINVRRQTAKLIKNNATNFIQEVEVELQLVNVTMKEFCRLLREMEARKRKFTWIYCKIDPDNPNTPTSLRVNAKLRAYVLTENALQILEQQPADSTVTSNKDAKTGKKNNTGKHSGQYRNRQTPPQNMRKGGAK